MKDMGTTLQFHLMEGNLVNSVNSGKLINHKVCFKFVACITVTPLSLHSDFLTEVTGFSEKQTVLDHKE